MISRDKIFAGVYSFCFPGLGQLFNSRPFVSLCFFVLFSYCEWDGRFHWVLPVIAFISSWEAFGRFKNKGLANSGKIYLYASVATLALIYWMLLLAPNVIPMSYSPGALNSAS